jgi:hypothetical protein
VIPETYNYGIDLTKDLEAYVALMLQEKQYVAPLRVVVAGNDCQFNDFVTTYVEKIL